MLLFDSVVNFAAGGTRATRYNKDQKLQAGNNQLSRLLSVWSFCLHSITTDNKVKEALPMATTCFEEIGCMIDAIRRDERYNVSRVDIYLETEAYKDHIRGSIMLEIGDCIEGEIMIDSYDVYIDPMLMDQCEHNHVEKLKDKINFFDLDAKIM